ncbi:HAMP domain-containing histidine kinase, partial [Planctomycetota bacterium]|nr:HAMP domain-containing histidine kinase [Planctomycetota bacterium]
MSQDKSPMTPSEAAERRRVLLLFGFTIIPPLLLLSFLAVVAARNDEAALRYVEEERTRQTAIDAQQRLEEALLLAERDVFRAVDPSLFRSDRRLDRAGVLARLREERPTVGRFFAISLSGKVLWPTRELPFRGQGLDASDWEPPEEVLADAPLIYQRRAELQAIYASSVELEDLGNLPQAVAGFEKVAASPEATPTMRARAAFRAAVALEQLQDQVKAKELYALAAASPYPVRDERGAPVRVRSTLRCAELALSMGDRAVAAEQAQALALELLAPRSNPELTEAEWRDALAQARAVFDGAGGEPDATREITELATGVMADAAWRRMLESKLAPVLIGKAPGAAGGEIRHHLELDDPPRVFAFRVLTVLDASEGMFPWGEGVLLGYELDLDQIATQVLQPLLEDLRQDEAWAVAVLDARDHVQAFAGPEDLRGGAAEGGLPETAVALETMPLWSVRVSRTADGASNAQLRRTLLYGGLLGLTLFTAIVGGVLTLRVVGRQLELAKMKSDFVSNITHELKTPLTSVKMYGETLALGRMAKRPDKVQEYGERIVRESVRLQKLIENILDFARQDAAAKEYVQAEEDVADTVAEAVDLFRHSAKGRGFDLYVELPPVGELPVVDLDRDAIVRSVLNLLSNAVKYSGEDRYLRVTVKRESKENIAIGVEDKGIGIDEADLERIFE